MLSPPPQFGCDLIDVEKTEAYHLAATRIKRSTSKMSEAAAEKEAMEITVADLPMEFRVSSF